MGEKTTNAMAQNKLVCLVVLDAMAQSQLVCLVGLDGTVTIT